MERLRALFPPKPTLTEKNLLDQAGKVFIVTGASSGVGEQLASILYQHNATVYLAARSLDKATKAIGSIKEKHSESQGKLVFLHLDLGDLATIKKSVDEFLAHQSRLDVLFLNAGVMAPPQGSKTVQGYELQIGTNNLGHFLFVRYLHPLLKTTAASAPKNSVRVIWVSSSAVEWCPTPAMDFDNMDYKRDESAWIKYGRSKAGNVLHAVEFTRRTKGEGIISLSLNPGNLSTELTRHVSRVIMMVVNLMLYDPIYGAYTELYAGLSSEITEDKNGAWLQPWGRIVPCRKDLWAEDMGRKFWEWSEEQVKDY